MTKYKTTNVEEIEQLQEDNVPVVAISGDEVTFDKGRKVGEKAKPESKKAKSTKKSDDKKK
jgi:hypothetical protein